MTRIKNLSYRIGVYNRTKRELSDYAKENSLFELEEILASLSINKPNILWDNLDSPLSIESLSNKLLGVNHG